MIKNYHSIKTQIMISVGDKVCYIPFDGCPKHLYENGIVKSLNESDKDSVFVVYKCNDDWENYKNYTAANTKLSQLKLGWIK